MRSGKKHSTPCDAPQLGYGLQSDSSDHRLGHINNRKFQITDLGYLKLCRVTRVFSFSVWHWDFKWDFRDPSDPKSKMNTLHSSRSSLTPSQLASFPLKCVNQPEKSNIKKLKFESVALWWDLPMFTLPTLAIFMWKSDVIPSPQPQHTLTSSLTFPLECIKIHQANVSIFNTVLSKSFLDSFNNFKNKKS